jgi:predicted transcriptional regulator
MMNESVQMIMTQNPVFVSHDATLTEVFEKLLKNNIHCLPVLKSDQLIGMVCSYDLSPMLNLSRDLSNLQAKDVMCKKIIKLAPEDKIGTAAELLLDRRFKALPVVSNGKLVGIVTSYDVLRYEFKKEYSTPILYKDVLDNSYRAAM